MRLPDYKELELLSPVAQRQRLEWLYNDIIERLTVAEARRQPHRSSRGPFSSAGLRSAATKLARIAADFDIALGAYKEPTEKLCAEITSSKRERLRIGLRQHQGSLLADARLYALNADGDLLETGSGFGVRLEFLDDIIVGLKRTRDEAHRLGLLPNQGENV